MKLKDIFTDINTKVFVLVNQDDDDELNWTIEPTDYDLLPEEENGPSSNYIYLELSQLYKALGQTDEEIKYQLKFKDSSEIE